MGFHVAQQAQLFSFVEEHVADNFGENVFGGAGDTCVVEQVAGRIAGIGEHGVGEPVDSRVLVEALGALEQFDSAEHSAVLVLPASAGGQELFEHESALADLVFVPGQGAEVAEGAEHCGREYAACAQTAACGDG